MDALARSSDIQRSFLSGAADGTRTRTVFLPVNFKSTMSTDSITAAYKNCKFQTGENSGENWAIDSGNENWKTLDFTGDLRFGGQIDPPDFKTSTESRREKTYKEVNAKNPCDCKALNGNWRKLEATRKRAFFLEKSDSERKRRERVKNKQAFLPMTNSDDKRKRHEEKSCVLSKVVSGLSWSGYTGAAAANVERNQHLIFKQIDPWKKGAVVFYKTVLSPSVTPLCLKNGTILFSILLLYPA